MEELEQYVGVFKIGGYVYVCEYVYVCVCMYVYSMFLCICIYMYICMCIYVYMHVCVSVRMCIYMCMYMCVYMYSMYRYQLFAYIVGFGWHLVLMLLLLILGK